MANIVEDSVIYLHDCVYSGRFQSHDVRPSIFMVPKAFRDPSPSSFNPRIVSIGPLHRQDEHLQPFEFEKKTSLHNMLRFLNLQPEVTLRGCAEKVIDSMEIIRACYGGAVIYNDFDLANMMVMDACFILAFFLRYPDVTPTTNMFIINSIAYDLLLTENQIPFFILNIIFECTIVASGKFESAPLTTYIEVLLGCYNIFERDFIVHHVSKAPYPEHILGFVHKVYQPVTPMPSLFTSAPKSHSATELDSAGMNFKPHEDENWVLAMKLEKPSPLFSWFPNFLAIPPISWFQSPTLKMPMIYINGHTELIIRNLIIYEQYSNANKYVSSYVSAIGMLIKTPQDVAMLEKLKVLRNYLGSNEDAASMINSLSKDISNKPFYYDQEWKEMDVYYNSSGPILLQSLSVHILVNPGVSLLLLLQSSCLLLPWFKPSLKSNPHNPLVAISF